MQIRLTVVDPLGPPSEPWARAASCDVLVTAPAGTALAAVASALASVVAGDGGSNLSERGRESGGAVVLYAGAQRLDTQRCTLGEPPLIDGAVLALGTPAEPEPHPEADEVAAQLHVVAGPDAGGVHLLHGGQITIGRSADADVPLDDPDVSRLHCAVTVAADGRIGVADLGSTNGTTLSGTRLGTRPVRLAPGALLRIGESALRLTPPGDAGARVGTTPDGEGHVRVSVVAAEGHTRTPGGPADAPTAAGSVQDTRNPQSSQSSQSSQNTHGRRLSPTASPSTSTSTSTAASRPSPEPHTRVQPDGTAKPPSGETHHAYGSASWGAAGGAPESRGARGSAQAAEPLVPGQGRAPRIETRGSGGPAAAPGAPGAARPSGAAGDTHGAGFSLAGPEFGATAVPRARSHGEGRAEGEAEASGDGGRKGTPLRGTDVPQGVRRRGGLSKWARRLTGGRAEQETTEGEVYDDEGPVSDQAAPEFTDAPSQAPESWPDPATLLLTALGPGPRLWERGPGHPEALTVRLGTADRAAPDGSGLLPAVPVTAGLREVGALGLAGPRARLAGLARAVVAQLTALHSPEVLEVVLISTDRSRTPEERTAEWSWLGWLPHLRPGHGQDCRLLLAYDREQATARTGELLRRLEDHDAETAAKSLTGGGGGEPDRRAQGDRGAERRPSWARDDGPDGSADGFAGPYTVVVVDGDPGGAAVREAVARLAQEGPRAGIHVVCLAETEAASPSSPVTETYEAACAASPPFRECGAVALLGGDVATALHVMRVARAGVTAPGGRGYADTGAESGSGVGSDAESGSGSGSGSGGMAGRMSAGGAGLVGQGSVAAVDAVSLAWAERFARALAPLRTDGAAGGRQQRVSAPLPQAARLLDELGLARATPASLMARWADAADDTETLGGRAWAVLGAGPRGPVGVDLAAEGPHLLIEGPPGSGRTELLRAVVASLAAAERPDRLGIVLMDGRDGIGGNGGSGGSGGGAQHGEGLRVCTDLPHVTTHLTANDPVRMREFAQSLSAELKRRAELLGRVGFAEWHTGRRELSGRIGPQRSKSGMGSHGSVDTLGAGVSVGAGDGAGDLDSPPSSTMRLRPAASRRRTETPPLARLVVVVDDLDALVSPALGSPGRPSAGSVVRALEAVAREGERLGVHLVAAAGVGGRTAETELARGAVLRVVLDAPAPGPDEPAAGRGRLSGADGRGVPFQGGRVTGRIPRTATLRPTVAALDWQRMGDPPTRRPVRELGNGPTDLALLASALERAARSVSAAEVPSLL